MNPLCPIPKSHSFFNLQELEQLCLEDTTQKQSVQLLDQAMLDWPSGLYCKQFIEKAEDELKNNFCAYKLPQLRELQGCLLLYLALYDKSHNPLFLELFISTLPDYFIQLKKAQKLGNDSISHIINSQEWDEKSSECSFEKHIKNFVNHSEIKTVCSETSYDQKEMLCLSKLTNRAFEKNHLMDPIKALPVMISHLFLQWEKKSPLKTKEQIHVIHSLAVLFSDICKTKPEQLVLYLLQSIISHVNNARYGFELLYYFYTGDSNGTPFSENVDHTWLEKLDESLHNSFIMLTKSLQQNDYIPGFLFACTAPHVSDTTFSLAAQLPPCKRLCLTEVALLFERLKERQHKSSTQVEVIHNIKHMVMCAEWKDTSTRDTNGNSTTDYSQLALVLLDLKTNPLYDSKDDLYILEKLLVCKTKPVFLKTAQIKWDLASKKNNLHQQVILQEALNNINLMGK